MEPIITLNAQALKALIKESVREVIHKEWCKFFDLLLPYVDDQEQADIEASFSPTTCADQDLVDVTDWFEHGNQTQ